DPRDEGDAPRVRKPLDSEGAGRDRGDAPRLAAVGRHHVDLRLLVVFRSVAATPLGEEGDPFPVGRPTRLAVLFTGGSQAARLAAERREDPETRARLVVAHVVGGHGNAGLR